MSFAGFVFDMIRRDKENRSMRNLRRERLNNRLDKLHDGRTGMPQNTTAEDMQKIARQTAKREKSELRYSTRMTLAVIGICIILASILVVFFVK